MSKIIKADRIRNTSCYTFGREAKKTCQSKELLTPEMAGVVYAETKEMVKDLIREAANQSERIINEAKRKAQTYVEQAKEEAAAWKEAAREEGYDKGYEQGLTQAQKEMKPVLDQTKALFEALVREKNDLLRKQDQEIIRLVFSLTRKILGGLVESRPEVIQEIVKKALQLVQEEERITVRVNPVHIPYLLDIREELGETDPNRVSFEEDPRIEPGDCVLGLENGFIESKIEEQLAILEQEIMKELGDA